MQNDAIPDTKRGIKKFACEMRTYLYGLSRAYSVFNGKIPSHHIRKVLMKYVFCMNLSKGSVLHYGFEIRAPWNITIGNSVVGANALLDGRKGIIIHDDVYTKTGGIFVAGDARLKPLRQLTTAVGDGSLASLAVIKYLKEK